MHLPLLLGVIGAMESKIKNTQQTTKSNFVIEITDLFKFLLDCICMVRGAD